MALEGDTSHPSAEELASRLSATSGMSLSTVYKVLHELVGIGVVQRLAGGAVMRFDSNVDSHAHLWCTDCGGVVDIDTIDPASHLADIAARHGHRVERVTLFASGRCAACVTRGGSTDA